MRTAILFVFILLLSCTNKQNTEVRKNNTKTSDIIPKSDTEIIERFVDSTRIGEKGSSKIEIIKHRVFEDNYIIVKFYKKRDAKWKIINTYWYECDIFLPDLNSSISDFNNDQFNDVTFISATAARGANEVRRLFIYDKEKQELISIVNSEDFPNMSYNKELDCIEAFLVHGGSTTLFANIKQDSLKEFAGLDNEDYTSVFIVNNKGDREYVGKDSITNMKKVHDIRYKKYMKSKNNLLH